MAYVITESCIKCKYTDCVDVCPVIASARGPNMLVIDPRRMHRLHPVRAECPVEAIFAEDDVPDSQNAWIALNRELSAQWKPIIERKPAPRTPTNGPRSRKKQLLERG